MRKVRSGSGKKKQLQTKYMLLVLTVVCVLTTFGGLVLNISGGPLKSIAGFIFIPMQQGINTTGEWIFDTANEFRTLSEVLEENEKLQAQVDELTVQLTESKMDAYELERLRDLLELDEKYPTFDKLAASVVGKDSGNWFSSFTINRGSNHGVEKGMNVIAGSGLVGIVTDVGPNYAKVRSIIDDANNVSSMIPTTGNNLNVSGDLKAMNESLEISFSGLRDDDGKIKVGDPVVTSYVSDQYHQGILIGYISSIENGSNNLTKVGTITPVVNFSHLEEVLVITKVKDIEGDAALPETAEGSENTDSSDGTQTGEE